MHKLRGRPRRELAPSIVTHALMGLCTVLLATSAAAREPASPLAVYGRLAALEDLSLSPDGSRIAFIKTQGDERVLQVLTTVGGKVLGGAVVGDTKLRSVSWQDNDRILLTTSASWHRADYVYESFELSRFFVSTGKVQPVPLLVTDLHTLNGFAGAPVVRIVDGKALLFVHGFYRLESVKHALFSVGDGFKSRIVAKGFESTASWLIDASGNVAAQLDYDQVRQRWTLKLPRKGELTAIASGTASVDVPTLLGFNGSAQIVVEFVENGTTFWRTYDIADGAAGAPLSEGSALRGVLTDPYTGRIYGGVRIDDDRQYVFFDNETQAHWNFILRSYPGEIVHLAAHSPDFSKMIVEVFGKQHGFVYAYSDWYEHRTQVLGEIYSGLKETAPVRAMHYRAADGLALDAVLTLPPSPSAERQLPLVVLPHGGPATQDTERFDWWAQALAVNGYAVLQPNYRGSSESRALMQAGYGEWGRKMQTDVSDGVQFLAEQGTIDPKRVCIVGASYGGYAALAGVALQSGIYRCAMSLAGPADLHLMRSRAAAGFGRDLFSVRYWDRYWGDRDKAGDTALRAISPADHAEAVTVPVLLIHGRDDSVVPFEQSELMLRALRKAGKPVQLIELKNEDHWLSTGETRLQMLESTLAFLKANNPPD
jgi:dipeptidyl aminopeptidase/acylaminoacyl peptidase